MKRLLLLAITFSLIWPTYAVERLQDKPIIEHEDGKGILYVLRESRFAGRVRSFFVLVDGKFEGVLANNSYAAVHLDAGEHCVIITTLNLLDSPLVRSGLGQIRQRVRIEAGRNHYFTMWPKKVKGPDGKKRKQFVVSEEEGALVVQALKYYSRPEAKEVEKASRWNTAKYVCKEPAMKKSRS